MRAEVCKVWSAGHISKVLLVMALAVCVHVVYGSFTLPKMEELGCYHTECMASKVQNIYHLALGRENSHCLQRDHLMSRFS